MAHRLQPLVNPASIAVVGATRRASAPGNEVILNLQKGGYQGRLYAINPGYDEVLGIRCYSSIAEIDEPVEHVIFAVSDARIESALEEVIECGVKAATIFSSLELGQGDEPGARNLAPLRERVRSKAQAAGLLLAGGNGMGFYNFPYGVWACGFDTRGHASTGNVVLLSQSGAGMSGIMDCDERIDFLFAASTGQELVVGVEDYLDYVLELPETRVIGLFLETSRQPEKFTAALARACERGVPVIAVKVGKSELASELAVSHSGALVGTDASYQAVFDRYGVQRVADMDELATTLIMFAQPHAVGVGGLVSIHDSGGERALFSDLAEREGIAFAPLSAQTRQVLAARLDPGLSAVNPLDAWGAGGEDADEVMADCFLAMLQDPGAALGAVVHDRAPWGKIYPEYLDYLERGHKPTGKPVFLVSARQGTGTDPLVVSATRRGYPVLDGVASFLVGVRCLFSYRDFLSLPVHGVPELPEAAVSRWKNRLAGQTLTEMEAAGFLSEMGLPMLAYRAINSAAECKKIGPQLRYPVVLKTAASGVAHKSDVGGVVLNVSDEPALRDSYRRMCETLGDDAVVAPMMGEDGVEMILGISSDDQFGPMLVMGVGGVHAELLHDVMVLQPPISAACARRALQQLKMSALLEGVRGSDPVDTQQFCDMAARLSVVATTFSDEIEEVDINPVKLTADGCMGLDALVVLKPTGVAVTLL